MRISDWSSDVCSSDLGGEIARVEAVEGGVELPAGRRLPGDVAARIERAAGRGRAQRLQHHAAVAAAAVELHACVLAIAGHVGRAHRCPLRGPEIGTAPVGTPVTNAPLVSRLLLAKTH